MCIVRLFLTIFIDIKMGLKYNYDSGSVETIIPLGFKHKKKMVIT